LLSFGFFALKKYQLCIDDVSKSKVFRNMDFWWLDNKLNKVFILLDPFSVEKKGDNLM